MTDSEAATDDEGEGGFTFVAIDGDVHLLEYDPSADGGQRTHAVMSPEQADVWIASLQQERDHAQRQRVTADADEDPEADDAE